MLDIEAAGIYLVVLVAIVLAWYFVGAYVTRPVTVRDAHGAGRQRQHSAPITMSRTRAGSRPFERVRRLQGVARQRIATVKPRRPWPVVRRASWAAQL